MILYYNFLKNSLGGVKDKCLGKQTPVKRMNKGTNILSHLYPGHLRGRYLIDCELKGGKEADAD